MVCKVNNYQKLIDLGHFEASPSCIWIFDIDANHICWANAEALSFWSVPSRLALRESDKARLSFSSRERLEQLFDRGKLGLPVRETWTLFPKGEPLTLVLDATAVTVKEDRHRALIFELVHTIDFSADPCGLRLLEAARETSVAVSVFDTECRLVAENPAAAGLHARASSGPVKIEDRYPEVDICQVAGMVLSNGASQKFAYQFYASELLHYREVKVSRSVDPITGEPTLILTDEDISERVRLSQKLHDLNQKLEAKVRERSVALEKSNKRLRAEAKQRRLAQQQAEQDRDFLGKLLEAIPVPVFFKNSIGEYLGCNQSWAEFVGFPKSQILGNLVEDILSTNGAGGPELTDLTVLGDGTKGRFPMEITKKDGEVRQVESYKAPFETNDGSSGIIGTVIDVTDQKNIENELRNRELILREATKATKTGFLVYDNETRKVEYATDTFQHLIGASDDDYAALLECIDNRFPVMQNAQGEETRRIVDEAERNGGPFDISYQVNHGTSKGHTLRVKGYPLSGFGKKESTKRVSLLQDITDTVEMENKLRQSQKMEAIGMLTGGVAHDFNNLLAVIRGNADLLVLKQKFDPDLVGEIAKACQRGAELTQSLLAFAGQQPLRAEPTNLGARTEAMQTILERTLCEDIDLSIDYPPDLWEAYVDIGRVEDALLNLAINARDAMPHGGSLSIEFSNLESSKVLTDSSTAKTATSEFVVVSVADTGLGMSEAVLAKATEPFYTTKPVGSGSGLGLSMVYGFAQQSGGRLSICSELGMGTTVKLYLPRARIRKMESQTNTEKLIPPAAETQHVLVVEDDPGVRKMVERMLESLGYRCTSFDIAKKALTYLRDGNTVDLLLTDIVLPGGQKGTDLAKIVRDEFAELPIVFMSGYPSQSVIHTELISPDSILLSKPITRKTMGLTIQKMLTPPHKKDQQDC